MVNRISLNPHDIVLGGVPFRLVRDKQNAPLYSVKSMEVPEVLSASRGLIQIDDIGRQFSRILYDSDTLGYGDARVNPRRPLSVHRTMNMDVSNGYAVAAPTYRSSDTTVRYSNVVGQPVESTYNSLASLTYNAYNQAIRIAPGGGETAEQSWSYPVTDSVLFEGRVYTCFDTSDNIWRRSVSGTTVSWDRQAGTTTAIAQKEIGASADDCEEVTSAAFSLTDTTIRVGRLSNASVTPSVPGSTSDALQASGTMTLDSTVIALVSNRYMGLRFVLSVPQGATIVSAYMTIEINGSATGGDVTINGFAADNTGVFTSAANDITSRMPTTASVIWTVPAGGIAGDRINTASLVTILQEIVNRPGFASGNGVGFRLIGNNSSISVATFRTYDNAAIDAATLTVTYVDNVHIGARLQTVPIPQGATIDSASLTLQPSATKASGPKMRIYGVASDDTVAWSSTNKPTQQALTTAYVDWTPPDLTAGTNVTTPDLTTIVQEIKNRSGAASNNDISFVLRNHADNAASSFHTFKAFDGATGAGTYIRFDCTYRTSGQTSIQARRFGVVRNGLVRGYDTNKVSICPNGGTPTDSSQWSSPTGAGTYSYAHTNDWAINWLGGVGDQLCVGKGDGFYRYNPSTGYFDNIRPELAATAHTNNCQGTYPWKEVALIPLNDGGLLAYNGYSMDDVTPLRGATPTGDTVSYGRITAMVGDSQYVYAASDCFHIRTHTGVNLAFEVTTDGSTYTSYATNVTDNDASTSATLSALDTVANGDWYVVGADVMFMGVYLTLGTANTNTSTLTAEYWNGSAWTSLTAFDNTDLNGVTHKQDGAIYWMTQPTNWAKSTINSKSRYWVRFSVNTALGACTVTACDIIPSHPNLPSATNGTWTGADQAGLMSHILRGRLRREGENIDNVIVWTDVWAIPHGPIDKMFITSSAMGFGVNSGSTLFCFSRRQRTAISLPYGNPLLDPFYMGKNSDTADGAKNSNVLYLPATDVGGKSSWRTVDVEGRNIEGDDLLESFYRYGDIEWDTLWAEGDKAAAFPATLNFGVDGQFFELALALRDNDNAEREPPIITRVIANGIRIPDSVDVYEFTAVISDFVENSGGLPDVEHTAEDLITALKDILKNKTPVTLVTPRGEAVSVVLYSVEEQAARQLNDQPLITMAQIRALAAA